MRLLVNENFPGDAVSALRQRGHDVVWVREDAPGSRDSEVLVAAQVQDRILITFDKDFGELAFRVMQKAARGIILFRISTPSAEHIAKVAVEVLESRNDGEGHFSVIDDRRIRMTPLPG
jgi:predicted nuclease of predicted toxin-antitoxin system